MDLMALLRSAELGSPLWTVGWMLFSVSAILGMTAAVTGSCALMQWLVEAIDETRFTELQACQEMRIDQAQWHRQKHAQLGDGNHASLQRIDQLPGIVLARWAEKILLHYGDFARLERQALLYLALTAKTNMAPARLHLMPDVDKAVS